MRLSQGDLGRGAQRHARPLRQRNRNVSCQQPQQLSRPNPAVNQSGAQRSGGQPSTSQPNLGDSGISPVEYAMERGMSVKEIRLASALGLLPLAAITPRQMGAERVESAVNLEPSSIQGKVMKRFNEIKDKIFFDETLPNIGSARLSYARFLHMLNNRMIKRITIMGEGKVALVEVPIDQGGHDYDFQKYNKADLGQLFVPEFPEWKMEMIRFYVELPGDFWESSNFGDLIKQNLPHKTHDGYQHLAWLTQDGQYHPQVRVKDPNEAFAFLNAYGSQIVIITALLSLRVFIGVLEGIAYAAGLLKVKKSEKEQLAEDMGKSIAKSYNIGKKGKGTGVKFADVAGIEHVKSDIKDILGLLLGDFKFEEMGAHVPRGILLEGPPGTGKTYLAKAMADEAGIPFYSANGAEFVQMFQGVAPARIRSLFADARKTAPSIIFIDEVDAIGKARNADGPDGGSNEREQGLLQLLVEMDGFAIDDKVLVIAATNRKDVLDSALLRPGRFDRSIYMGKPGPENRYKILEVHARGKQIPRGNDDEFLRNVAVMAVGYSGAALANLLNEAAILQVRYAKPEIDLEVIQEAIAKMRVGLPAPSMPLSKAKRHMAAVLAGKAVAMLVTAGMPPVEAVSIRPFGNDMGRILSVPQEAGAAGDDWQRLAHNPVRGKSIREVGDFAFCVGLLTPLYMGRATEEVLFGRDSVTMSTSKDISTAGDLAHWLCLHSRVNPALLGSRYYWNLTTDSPDTVSQYMDPRPMEELCIRLQTLAYHRALLLVHRKRCVIETLTDELLSNRLETVQRERLSDLIDNTADAEVSEDVLESLPFKGLIPEEAESTFMVEEKNILRAIRLVKGDVDPGMTLSRESMQREAQLFANQSEQWLNQQKEKDDFATSAAAPFPSKPDLSDKVLSV